MRLTLLLSAIGLAGAIRLGEKASFLKAMGGRAIDPSHDCTTDCQKCNACTVTCPDGAGSCTGFAGKANKKCRPGGKKGWSCNSNCGWKSCPGCTSWTSDTCPPDDSVQCSHLVTTTANVEDPLACAADYMQEHSGNEDIVNGDGDSCQNDLNGDGFTDRYECIAITGSGGNRCMWYSFMNTETNVLSGRCGYNTCSNVNDGSCTLQQTGNRCVWYGNPKNLRTIDGQQEAPNPYQNTSGCYISPCNNPLNNDARGCEAMNIRGNLNGDKSDTSQSPYQCQWCNIKNQFGMNMGCQNTALTSVARASRISKFPEQGTAPCLNQYCNFFLAPGRTNNPTRKYETLKNSKGEWRTAVEAFGDGSAQSQLHCNTNIQYSNLGKNCWTACSNANSTFKAGKCDSFCGSAALCCRSVDSDWPAVPGSDCPADQGGDGYHSCVIAPGSDVIESTSAEGTVVDHAKENRGGGRDLSMKGSRTNLGKNCWEACRSSNPSFEEGRCDSYCGTGGICCRADDDWTKTIGVGGLAVPLWKCPAGQGGNGFHACIINPNEALGKGDEIPGFGAWK